MARRGTFGRLPRVAPSIASTLVAIAHEQQQQEDQNIMSAWQKGGSVDGQKVTDEAVLAHWRTRLKNVDAKDPLADTYRNVVLQYEYSIAESKMSLQYAQGHISDQTAASFYSNWAKKVPKNSEFYRTLMRDAAQYIQTARNKAASNSTRIAETNYQTAQAVTSDKYESAGNYLTTVFTNMARASAIIGGNQDPGNFDLSDPGVMLQLINSINQGPTLDRQHNLRGAPDLGHVLYHDPATGLAVTAGDVKAKLTQLDPHFNGTVNLAYYGQTLRAQGQGQAIRLEAATKTGHVSDMTKITNEQYGTISVAHGAAAWPIEEAASKARDVFMATYSNPGTSPAANVAAYDQYIKTMTDLRDSPRIATDDALKSVLNAEITGNGNIESLAVQMGAAKQGDAAETRAYIENFREWTDAVAKGDAVWSVGTSNSDGTFTPGAGTAIGAATREQVAALSPQAPVTVFIAQGTGLPDIPVQVAGRPVTVALLDSTGQPVPTISHAAQTVATVYNLPGGQMFGFPDSKGGMLFTRYAPWANGVQAEDTKGGVVLHMVVDPQAGQPGVAQSGIDANGKPTFTVNPSQFMFDQTRTIAGANPFKDSFSPTIAYRTPEPTGTADLQNLARNNPQFKAQLDFEAHVFGAGQTISTDATGQQVWTGGDATAYERSAANGAVMTNLSDFNRGVNDFVVGMSQKLFGREDTAPAFSQMSAPYGVHDAQAIPPSTGPSGMGPWTTPKLPSDLARGTAFDGLAAAFAKGNSLLLRQPAQEHAGLTINTGLNLTVPNVPAQTVPTLPYTPTPTATQPVGAAADATRYIGKDMGRNY